MEFFDDKNYTADPAFNYDNEEGYEGVMETYEPFITEVIKQYEAKPRTVWTVYDYEDDIHIRAGFYRNNEEIGDIYIHNVVLYFISLEEWQEPDETYIWFKSEL